MATLYTLDNGPNGEDVFTERERFSAVKGEGEAARAAAAEALRQQLALQAQMNKDNIADRQSGRAQQGAQFDKGLAFDTQRDAGNHAFDLSRDSLNNDRMLGLEKLRQGPLNAELEWKKELYNREHRIKGLLEDRVAQEILSGKGMSDQGVLSQAVGGNNALVGTSGGAGASGGAPAPAGQYDGVSNPFGTSGGTPTRSSRTAVPQLGNDDSYNGGAASALNMLSHLNNPMLALEEAKLAGDERRRKEDRGYATQNEDITQRNSVLDAALASAKENGDDELYAKILAQKVNNNQDVRSGKPFDSSVINSAIKPSPLVQETRDQKNSAIAASSLDFNNSIDEIAKMSDDVIHGRSDAATMVAKANDLTAKVMKSYKVSEAYAKKIIGEALDKKLPGLGRDIGSILGDTGFLWGAWNKEAPRVGAATGTRTAFKQSGYLK